eukprot:SAG11_NODE_542_length_8640_cov_5.667603_13_plen_166_part_00
MATCCCSSALSLQIAVHARRRSLNFTSVKLDGSSWCLQLVPAAGAPGAATSVGGCQPADQQPLNAMRHRRCKEVHSGVTTSSAHSDAALQWCGDGAGAGMQNAAAAPSSRPASERAQYSAAVRPAAAATDADAHSSSSRVLLARAVAAGRCWAPLARVLQRHLRQ